MKNNIKLPPSLRTLLAAVSTCLLLASPAQASLLGRNITGQAVAGSDASAVFLYDTHLNITWLRDANMNGRMNWGSAVNWANTLTVGTFGGWRLPSTLQPDTSCSNAFVAPEPNGNQYYGAGCTGSEWGELWHTQLGNAADTLMSNSGDFLNLQFGLYWSGTEVAPEPVYAWSFYTTTGLQTGAWEKTYDLFALAVRSGDVLAGGDNTVPEPPSLLLLLLALAGLGGL